MFFSWLLRDPNMKVRSNYKPYQDAVERFFGELLPKVTDLQVINSEHLCVLYCCGCG